MWRSSAVWAFLVSGPALLWWVLVYWISQALAHSDLAANDRLQMQLILVSWMAVTAMATVARLLWRQRTETPAPTPARFDNQQ